MATQRQKQAAYNGLMRAIHAIEAAQNTAAAQQCKADGILDMSWINEAKDRIHHAIRTLEAV